MNVPYLDFNSTAPINQEVVAEILQYLTEDFGNSGSRTHEYGQIARSAVKRSRDVIAEEVETQPEAVIFTSGATESNNMAVLGLAEYASETGKNHIVTTAIEHKSVLAPVEKLKSFGFQVDIVPPQSNGCVSADQLIGRVNSRTVLVSVMGANNETGAVQPIVEIANALHESDAYLHVDASQTFCKLRESYRNPRIDLLTLSAHKVGGPKGVGALIVRRRGFERPPLSPIQFGGGQERGLRPGTVPVPLVAGFAKAIELSTRDLGTKLKRARTLQQELLAGLEKLDVDLNSAPELSLPTTLNFSVPGLDSEAAILALRDIAAVSNGSACTSQSYEPSYVLTAAGLPESQINGAIRVSWGLDTESLPTSEIVAAIGRVIS